MLFTEADTLKAIPLNLVILSNLSITVEDLNAPPILSCCICNLSLVIVNPVILFNSFCLVSSGT